MKTIAQYFAVCLLARFYLSIPARAQVVTLRGRVELTNPAKSRKPSDNSNEVVWLMPSAATQHPPLNDASRRRFRLIQQRKRFEPHVLVVPVGSVVEFPNLDPFFHNVFSLFDGKRELYHLPEIPHGPNPRNDASKVPGTAAVGAASGLP